MINKTHTLILTFFLVFTFVGGPKAESVPSPQTFALSKYQALSSDKVPYSEKLRMAEEVITNTPSDFFTCYSDHDCVVVEGICGGDVAIAAYGAEGYYNNARQLYGSVIDCEYVERDPNAKAVCKKPILLKSKCVLTE